jgi:hypothetical protein
MTSVGRPIPTFRIIRRTVECEIAYTVSRLRVLERIAGNPSASPSATSTAAPSP